jgi:predicted metalloendopeptidase
MCCALCLGRVSTVLLPVTHVVCLCMHADLSQRLAQEEGLPELEWMDAATAAAAKSKAEHVDVKIGFPPFVQEPDELRAYYSAQPVGSGFFANVLAAAEAATSRNLAKLNRASDRSEWHMTASTVNAYYNPPSNEIVFPAAILQPTFFHRDYLKAVNFGGIGQRLPAVLSFCALRPALCALCSCR